MSDDAATRAHFRAMNALLSREPGYAVAAKCLEVQAESERLDPTLRTDGRVRLADGAWSWYVGACGEKEVGGHLARLGPDWMVRHAVPIGSGTQDVDHLVIGPGGVFAINTKHHRDASIWVGDHVLKVGGANTRHLDQARRDATNAARRLTARVGFAVSVTTVLVTVGERSISDARRGPRTNPAVVSSRQLVEWLGRQRPAHSVAELGLIRLAAEEPGTWHVDPTAADTLRVMQRFDRLMAEVGAAPKPVAVAAASSPSQSSGAARAAARPTPARRPRQTRSPRRPTKAEIRRQERRREDLAKLVMLLVAGLSSPLWLPGAISLLTDIMVNAATPGP